jgi:uncharacterized protein
MSRNQLDRETSPYLLQHADNPVHWRAWGPEALAEARAADKPILLSIGYAACHWCHVMAHESFENPDIAALMNQFFVNIKVDREERPDLDSIYQNALALTGEHGGWPLTMFLTPEGAPFWGGTYFPSQPRFGRPGFPDVLRRIADVYQSDREAIAKNRDAILAGLQRLAGPQDADGGVPLSLELLDEVAQRLTKEVDPVLGGIGQAPKFPQTGAFELIWRAYLRSGDRRCREAVETTLKQMCQGGIYDHLLGGFARYSTDARWLAPHFEKMLYDNALMIDLLTLVWQGTGEPLYRLRVAETARWVLAEMIAEGGGFAATLDADSEGEEGKFYVWRAAEIDSVLGAAAAEFKAFYDVSPDGNWEGKNILNRSKDLTLADLETETRLAQARAKLLAARAARIRPGWDDKVLADWNGLMIAALANAGAVFDQPDWLDAAKRAFAFVAYEMSADGRLYHSHRAGENKHAGLLDDYANMARAALLLHEVTGDPSYLALAEAWLSSIDRHFVDEAHGGYFIAPDDADDLITRPRHCQDHAVPAGNATLAQVSLRLWHLSGEAGHRRRAERIFGAFSGELRRNYFPLTSFLNAVELALAPLNVVLLGRRDDPALLSLLATVNRAALPNRVLSVVENAETLPPAHPAHGMQPLDRKATAYVCIANACSLPVTTPKALAGLLPRPPEAT